ncbi:integrin alpha [Nitrosomonas ureae]|uniref:FG-GAP repeat-containing protein n=1 Tax=Nitrosomonas ureae TaxID=44577 RepID=A0A1H9GQA7_9PROT|nr:integrin alpha [Nitrosomonas ureae]SEQ52223.1 FG-GAP repeat-containing protein [Nitrosomonas ureae]
MTTTSINLSSLDGSNGFRLDGRTPDRTGFSVSNAGDINGDGFDDVIVGSSGLYAYSSSNLSYVVFGKESGFSPTVNLPDLDGNNGFRLDGVPDGFQDSMDHLVSGVGDINGDGFDDFAITESTFFDEYYIGSKGYIVFGKEAEFNAMMDLGGLDGSDGFFVLMKQDNIILSIKGAGDINDDGFDDLIVSDGETDQDGITYHEFSYIVFGKSAGFGASLDLSNFDGSNGFRLEKDTEYSHNGSVSTAGDVNGDGFDDFIVGGGALDSYVVFGKASGFDASLHLSNLNGSDGFRLHSGEGGISAVSTAGDVNGDGFDDFIVDGGALDSYVVFGKASGFDASLHLSNLNGSDGFRLHSGEGGISAVSTAGDVNGDGFDDFIVDGGALDSYVVFGKASGFDASLHLSNLNGSDGFRLHSGEGGISAVSNAGDVNGDGFDDVIIGVSRADQNGGNSGSSYVVFGKAVGFDASVNLFDLDGSNGFRLDGVAAGDRSGWSVSTAGDVNEDGFDDLLVGAPDISSSYVIFGRSSFVDEVDFPGTPGDDIFTGTSAAESFEGGDGSDRMIGRGGADSFDSGAGNDYIRILGDDFQFVDGGLGTDILGLAGSGYNLDLSNVIDNIHGIETIALYGVGDNTVTLTAQDVIDLSQETNTLKIKGNAGDRVVGLSSGWTDGGVHGNFHTYTQGEAVLLIGVDVTTDFPIA